MNIAFKQAFERNKIWMGTITTGIGFFSDVCQPLAPFSQYLLIVSLIVLAISLLAYSISLLSKFRGKVLPIMLFSLFSVLVNGGMFALQHTSEKNENNGFMAGNIAFLENMQNSLGIIQKDVEQIKSTTLDIKSDTTSIKSSVTEVSSKIDSLSESVGKQGGIISNPETSRDFYHNARIYELKGDYANARKSYIQYFRFSDNKLDPHLRFQSFLKIQEGVSGAKEIYQEMFSQPNNLVDEYAKLLLDNIDVRRVKIKEFIDKNPDFAPAYYELAKLHSKDVLGNQGLSDKKSEKDYVEKFIMLNKEGKLVKYFLDKEELDSQIKYISERKTVLDNIDDSAFDNPVNVQRMWTNSSWQLNLSIPDEPAEILYRVDGNGEFISTGYYDGYVYQDTGKPMPKFNIDLPNHNGVVKEYIEFKYIDQNNNEMGPFRYNWISKTKSGKDLDPKAESNIKSLENSKAFIFRQESKRVDEGRYLLYFSHILSYADGVEKIMYGIDTDIPNIEYSKPYDLTNLYIDVGKDFHKVSLQLYYKDETVSDVLIFKFN